MVEATTRAGTGAGAVMFDNNSVALVSAIIKTIDKAGK